MQREKDKEYQLKILFEKRKKLHRRMTRKCKLIDDLMYSSSNVTTVKEETDQFNDQFKELLSLHKEYVGLLPQEVANEEDDWFETVDEVVFTQKHKIYNWIKEVEDDNKSRSSRSSSKKSSGRSSKKSSSSSKTKSSRSSLEKTSVRERALEEKLKMAELLAEASFTEEKHAAIFNAEKLRQTEELAKLKARSQIFDEIENERYLADRYLERNNPTLMEGRTQASIITKIEKGGLMDRARNISEIRNTNINSNKKGCQKEADVKGNTKAAKYSVGELPKSKNQKEENKLKLNPLATSYVPAKMSNNEEMYNLLINMIQQQAAPEVELECFDGNPLEYNHFADLFREVVEKWIPEPKGRLLRLLKYTRGEAHDLIKHCVQEPSYMGYSHAQQLLRKRYGDPHIILSTYRKKSEIGLI